MILFYADRVFTSFDFGVYYFRIRIISESSFGYDDNDNGR